MSATPQAAEYARIGPTMHIKGEISGNEDVYIDGQVEGMIQLAGNSLTVGPNGRIEANISARNVTVSGTLAGNIQASERTELRKTAVVNGDVETRRIAIEDGAFFKGKLGDSERTQEPTRLSSCRLGRSPAEAGYGGRESVIWPWGRVASYIEQQRRGRAGLRRQRTSPIRTHL